MFKLLPVAHDLHPKFRGIQALSNIDNNPNANIHHNISPINSKSDNINKRNSLTNSSPNRVRRLSESTLLPLQIQLITIIPGHIAVSYQNGTCFTIFDTINTNIPGIVNNNIQLSDYEQDKLNYFIRSVEEFHFNNILALRTVDSNIIHMQFIYYNNTNNTNNINNNIRILIVQANATFLIWQWEVALYKWIFISRGSINTNVKMHSCAYETKSNSLFYLQHSTTNTNELQLYSTTFASNIPTLTIIPDIITVTAINTIPLTCSLSTKFELKLGTNGLFIYLVNNINSIYYYNIQQSTLSKIKLSNNDNINPNAPNNNCIITIHPNTNQLLIVDNEYNFIALNENNSTPTSTTLCKLQVDSSKNISANGSSNVNPIINDSSKLLAFRNIIAIINNNNGSKIVFYSLNGGIFLDKIENEYTNYNVTQCIYGYGGSGSILYNSNEVYFINTNSTVKQQIKSISNNVNGNDNPVNLAKKISTYYNNTSLTKQLTIDQYIHNRNNNDYLINTISTLQSPALPIALYTNNNNNPNNNTANNNQSYYIQDYKQYNIIENELNKFLSALQLIGDNINNINNPNHDNKSADKNEKKSKKSKKSSIVDSNGNTSDSTGNNSSPELKSTNTPANSENKSNELNNLDLATNDLSTRRVDCYHYLTPLNVTLLPILKQHYNLLKQLKTYKDQIISNNIINDNNNLPTLLNQLQKSLANRMTPGSNENTRDRSLQSLLLFDFKHAFDYIQQLVGLKSEVKDNNNAISDSNINSAGPNLLLINEELKIKKENNLLYSSDNAHMSSLLLNRSDNVGYFEILCRLYDQLQPNELVKFINIVKDLNNDAVTNINPSNNTSNNPKLLKAVSNETIENYEKPVLTAINPNSYYERAIRILSPILPLETASQTDINSTEFQCRLSRVSSRCWLLVNCGKIVEAVLLRLQLSQHEDHLFSNNKDYISHEEEAIRLAYSINKSNTNNNPHNNPNLLSLKSELFHHYLCFWIDKQMHLTELNLKSNNTNNFTYTDMDTRILSLMSPHFTVHNYLEIVKQRLEKANPTNSSNLHPNLEFELNNNNNKKAINDTNNQAATNKSNDRRSRAASTNASPILASSNSFSPNNNNNNANNNHLQVGGHAKNSLSMGSHPFNTNNPFVTPFLSQHNIAPVTASMTSPTRFATVSVTSNNSDTDNNNSAASAVKDDSLGDVSVGALRAQLTRFAHQLQDRIAAITS